MTGRHRVPAAVVLAATLVLLSWSAAAPVASAGSPQTISYDGRRWASTGSAPLWDAGTTWAPGDRRTASLWLRNDADEDARFAVAVRAEEADGDTALAPALRATVAVDGAQLAVGSTPVTLPRFAPGDLRRIDLTLALPADVGNAVQRGHAEIRVRVSAVGDLGATVVPTAGWPVYLTVGVLLGTAGALALIGRRGKIYGGVG